MSKQNISSASEFFVSDLSHPVAIAANGRKGIPVDFPTHVSLGTPGVAVADYIIKAATSTELPNASTKTYTTATDNTSPLDGGAAAPSTLFLDGADRLVWVLDVPRALTGVMTHGSAVVASTALISGYDVYGNPMTELMTFTAGTTSKTVAGKKAFKYIYSVAITAATDATANTFNLGTNEVLGLPYRLAAKADFILNGTYFGDTLEATAPTVVKADATTPATTSTGDVRGTVDLNSTLDGSEVVVLYFAAKTSHLGVTQV